MPEIDTTSTESNTDASTDTLPPELLVHAFSFLSPETLAITTKVNKRFNNLANAQLLWREKFQRHFNNRYDGVLAKTDPDWQTEFQDAYADEYPKTSIPERELFSIIKESDIERLQQLTFLRTNAQDIENRLTLLSFIKKDKQKKEKWPLLTQ